MAQQVHSNALQVHSNALAVPVSDEVAGLTGSNGPMYP